MLWIAFGRRVCTFDGMMINKSSIQKKGFFSFVFWIGRHGKPDAAGSTNTQTHDTRPKRNIILNYTSISIPVGQKYLRLDGFENEQY